MLSVTTLFNLVGIFGKEPSRNINFETALISAFCGNGYDTSDKEKMFLQKIDPKFGPKSGLCELFHSSVKKNVHQCIITDSNL